jgi:hypothetical protein
MIDKEHPWHRRATIFDKVLLKWRKQFWNELTPAQQMAELEYQNEANKRLLKRYSEDRENERH